MKISVIGTGYVGLITGACFAKIGHTVYCVDIIPEKIEKINKKQSPIYEEGLDQILNETVGKTLFASLDLTESIKSTDITFICVGTPSLENGNIDLSYVFDISKKIINILSTKEDYHLLVIKSTVLPGTTEKIIEMFDKNDIGLCMNPEFLREGNAIYDFFYPDRIVIGEKDKKSGDILNELYKDFNCPKMRLDLKTAEMIKYSSNAFLATKVSFINEIGNICKILGVDVYEVARGMGLDSRISPKFLEAGCGFGGSCFPKDVKALINYSKDLGYDTPLLRSVVNVNQNQPLKMIEILENKIGNLENKKIGVLGLAFKKDSDDIRESPSIAIIQKLLEKKSEVLAYDPKANNNMKYLFPNIIYLESPQNLIESSDAILIVTDWEEFKYLNYSEKIVIEGRRIFDQKQIGHEGVCW